MRSLPSSESVGLTVAKAPALDELLERTVGQSRAAPSAVLGFGRRDSRGFFLSIGSFGDLRSDAADAIFDLASVTKPLTALAALRAVSTGAFTLEARVGEVLPELRDLPAASASLDLLLAHRAGLPAWGALYRREPWSATTAVSLPLDEPLAELPRLLERAASRVDLAHAGAQSAPVYSDLGYVLAGAMIVRALGVPLAEAWEAIAPATSAARWRARDDSRDGSRDDSRDDFEARVLPTEHVPWRGGDVRGVVHDENAFMIERAGGSPGHAGAFGRVGDVAIVAARFLDALRGAGDLLPRALAERMIEPWPIGSHRLGWDGISVGASSSGSRFSSRGFGHLGFTGTSVWIDPGREVFVVLLTNRTFPTRENTTLRALRPSLHDEAWRLWESGALD